MPRRGTKRERHLAHFRETGQMTAWLEKRLTWDEKLAKELLDEALGHKPVNWTDALNANLKQYFTARVAEQFETQSLFYKLLTAKEEVYAGREQQQSA